MNQSKRQKQITTFPTGFDNASIALKYDYIMIIGVDFFAFYAVLLDCLNMFNLSFSHSKMR